MQETYNILSTILLAISVLALNLAVQAMLVLNPEKLKDRRLGWGLFAGGFLLLVVGVLLITVLRLPALTWISVGVVLAIPVALTQIVQAERLRKQTGDDRNKFARHEYTIAKWLIRVAAVTAIALMIVPLVFRS